MRRREPGPSQPRLGIWSWCPGCERWRPWEWCTGSIWWPAIRLTRDGSVDGLSSSGRTSLHRRPAGPAVPWPRSARRGRNPRSRSADARRRSPLDALGRRGAAYGTDSARRLMACQTTVWRGPSQCRVQCACEPRPSAPTCRSTSSRAHSLGSSGPGGGSALRWRSVGWSGNADHNAARNVLHLYRVGPALISAAGRAVVRRARRVKPAAAR